MKETYDNNFYETEEDPLQGFRKRYGGGVVMKNDVEPFSKDPDSVQADHQDKLAEKQSNNLFT